MCQRILEQLQNKQSYELLRTFKRNFVDYFGSFQNSFFFFLYLMALSTSVLAGNCVRFSTGNGNGQ